jgi:acyl-coenzyme A synthetase/AMP-(fatty) acid ligase
MEDVPNGSKCQIDNADIESALVRHDALAKAAVVDLFHDIKSQRIYYYVTLVKNIEESEEDAKRADL